MCGMWQSQQRCPCLLVASPRRSGSASSRARWSSSGGGRGRAFPRGTKAAWGWRKATQAPISGSSGLRAILPARKVHSYTTASVTIGHSCSQIPVSHFTQSQTIDRTCMSNMCGAALHLDTTTLARVGHKPQPQGLECAASLARHKRNRASVNGHYVAARSLSWAVTGEPRGPLEAFLWRSLLRQFPLANIRRGGRGAGWCDGR